MMFFKSLTAAFIFSAGLVYGAPETGPYSVRVFSGLGWSSQIKADASSTYANEIDEVHAEAATGFPLGMEAGWNFSGNWDAGFRVLRMSSSASGMAGTTSIDETQSYFSLGALIGRRPADRSGFVWHLGLGYGAYSLDADLSEVLLSANQTIDQGGAALLSDLGWTFGIGERFSIDILVNYQRAFGELVLKTSGGLVPDRKLGDAAEFMGLTAGCGYSF